MYKNGNLKKIAAPALLLLTVLGLEYYRLKTGTFYTSAPIFPLVVLVAVSNGTLVGFVGAAIASGYAFYVTPDLMRALIVALSYFGMTTMIAYLNHRVRKIDTVEGLIHKLRVIHSLLLTNLVNWPDMDDGEKWRMVEQINEDIADIMTVVRGWHILAKERDSLDDKE